MAYCVSVWLVVAAAGLFDANAYQELSVEFDLPDEFWVQSEDDDTYVVTGFRLGYFRTNGQFPLRTVDFERSNVILNGESAQLPLDVEWLAGSRERIVVRLQTLTRDHVSEWSEPSESISIAAELVSKMHSR